MKVKRVESGLKNRQLKFSDEVRKTQSTKRQKLNTLYVILTEFFASNRRQDVNDFKLDLKH